MNTFYGCDMVKSSQTVQPPESGAVQKLQSSDLEMMVPRPSRVRKIDAINKKIFCEHVPEQFKRE